MIVFSGNSVNAQGEIISLTNAELCELDDRPLAHLVSLPGGPWALWRRLGLRGAGFPAELARRLSRPECSASAAGLLAAEDRMEVLREKAAGFINAALDELRQEDRWEEHKGRRKALLDGLRDLNKGRF